MLELLTATLETLEMSLVALLFSYIVGLPLGVLTNETSRDGLFPVRSINFVLEIIIGAGRAIPFTILMVLVLPFTRWLVGTGVGTVATIVPLTIAAIPFVARTVSNSLNLVDENIVKADTIEELCDRVVVKDFNNKEPRIYKIDKYSWKEIANTLFNIRKVEWVKFAIWTDKGLIYVAKMNEKGVLELL